MFGRRLQLARKKAGLTLRALADQISPKVTAQAIGKYESGKMMPSSMVLIGLGETLDVSRDFLLGSRVEAVRGIAFRRHSGTSARDRARAEAIVTEKVENYLVIEEALEPVRPDDPFGNLAMEYVDSLEQIDNIADGLRQHWSLGNHPIPSMSGLLEAKGIRVIEADLPERFDGLACDVLCTGGRPATSVVVVSSRTGVECRRLNLARALAHRVIRGTGHPELRLAEAMDRFARAFLVPAKHLAEETGAHRHGMTCHELMRLKRLYGVSAAAMLMRLGESGILAWVGIEYAFRSFAHAWRKEEPEPIGDGEGFGAFERPQRFESLVWRAVGERLISPVHGAQLLQLPLASVERGIQGPRG